MSDKIYEKVKNRDTFFFQEIKVTPLAALWPIDSNLNSVLNNVSIASF